MRTFEHKPAVRERMPLLLGIVAPSGAGKTYSALRLATGIQRVTGGEIFVIDTESRRSTHYALKPGDPPTAGKFSFQHLHFAPPFSSLDYLGAIEHCVKSGARVIVVDSFSHEHEGPGGLLEYHAAEVKRLAAAWRTSEDVVKMAAWHNPKRDRTRLIQGGILQMHTHFIFNFRAKKKLKIVKGKQPEPRGWMPITGEEFVYELTFRFLLYPGSKGVPTWKPEYKDEAEIVKINEEFLPLFANNPQLSEELGQKLAIWAEGEGLTVSGLLARYTDVTNAAALAVLEADRERLWKGVSKDERAQLKTASERAAERVRQAEEDAKNAPPDPPFIPDMRQDVDEADVQKPAADEPRESADSSPSQQALTGT